MSPPEVALRVGLAVAIAVFIEKRRGSWDRAVVDSLTAGIVWGVLSLVCP